MNITPFEGYGQGQGQGQVPQSNPESEQSKRFSQSRAIFSVFFQFVNLVINIPSVTNILHECGAIEDSES